MEVVERKVPCEVFSRVVGYLRPMRLGGEWYWHEGKKQEREDMVSYDPEKIMSHPMYKET